MLVVEPGKKAYEFYDNLTQKQIEAVDFNKRSIEHCKNDAQEDTTYTNQDLQGLSFADETFDFIICEGVAHHTLDPGKTLNELIRVLQGEDAYL